MLALVGVIGIVLIVLVTLGAAGLLKPSGLYSDGSADIEPEPEDIADVPDDTIANDIDNGVDPTDEPAEDEEPPEEDDEPAEEPLKTEPVVALSWGSGGTVIGTLARPQTLSLSNDIADAGNDTLIADMIYFPDLTSSQVTVEVHSLTGELLRVELSPDGYGGCYGVLVDSASNVQEGKSWTWSYNRSVASHTVTLDITFTTLGAHDLVVRAYDQETGVLVSREDLAAAVVVDGAGITSATIEAVDNGTVNNTEATGVFQAYKLHNEISAEFASSYQGRVRDTVRFSDNLNVEKVWLIVDGKAVRVTPDGDGGYSFYWDAGNGASSHDFVFQVQYGEPVSNATADRLMTCYVYDDGTGESLLADGEGYVQLTVLEWYART